MKNSFKHPTKHLLNWFIVFCIAPSLVCGLHEHAAHSSGIDPHSFSNPHSVRPVHGDFELTVDFRKKVLHGNVRWQIEFVDSEVESLILDVGKQKIFRIEAVREDGSRRETFYRRGLFDGKGRFQPDAYDETLGQALVIEVDASVRFVEISFQTAPDSPATMFLERSQTEDRRQPMLLTVSEPIGARHIFPAADTPGNRFTYNARIKTKQGVMALMSATENSRKKGNDGAHEIKMTIPIPTYLWSLAVGDFEFREMGTRTGVYAEPSLIDRATREFSELEEMIRSGEEIFGPYPWPRQDLLVLPAIGFAFSAMENPGLFYLSSYMVAGDRSLNFILAHELAHGFHTNVLANRQWSDLPVVNEGLTEYLRLLILEKVRGSAHAESQTWLDYQELLDQVERSPDYVIYRPDLTNPDSVFHPISYHKSLFFWMAIEKQVGGQEELIRRLNALRDARRYQTIGTQELLSQLLGRQVEIAEFADWLLGGAVPFQLDEPARLREVRTALEDWKKSGVFPPTVSLDDWRFPEYRYFFSRLLKEDIEPGQAIALLDTILVPRVFDSNDLLRSNVWRHYIRNGAATKHAEAIRRFLVGRSTLRLIRPLYQELVKTPQGCQIARNAFREGISVYAPVTVASIGQILQATGC